MKGVGSADFRIRVVPNMEGETRTDRCHPHRFLKSLGWQDRLVVGYGNLGLTYLASFHYGSSRAGFGLEKFLFVKAFWEVVLGYFNTAPAINSSTPYSIDKIL